MSRIEDPVYLFVSMIFSHPVFQMTEKLDENYDKNADNLKLVSKELNHFGVIADLFWQIGGHSSRFVLFCSF